MAEILGAYVSVNFLNAKEFILVRLSGEKRGRKVRHFSEYEANQYEMNNYLVLCVTSGENFSHCLYLATRAWVQNL